MPTAARVHAVAILATVGALALSACGGSDDSPTAGPSSGGASTAADRLQVVTTVAPITSIVANVAGERADVVGLVPEGTNSHTFDPPPSAAAVLSDADVLFINGLKLEEPTKELAEANLPDDAVEVELGTEVLPESDYLYDFSFPESGGKPNPHLWTDPTYAAQYAELVADTLSAADPEGSETYAGNLQRFLARVEALDAALRADQESVPPEDRDLLTYHDAYAYFAQTYDWRVVGAVQPESFEDPSPREVADLIDQVREEDVRAVFGSEVFPSPVLEQIGRETGARYVDVLRDDDLPGEPGDPEHSWLGLMRFDYVTMVEALGGRAPELKALDVSDVASDSAEYPQ